MEYDYINDIDNIIEDKAKLKELLLYLLEINRKRYDDYDSEQLYDLFLEIPVNKFINVLNNMICYEGRLIHFCDHIDNFINRVKVDPRNQLHFLLDHNYKVKYNNNISFEEHIFTNQIYRDNDKIYLQYLIEYFEENDELETLKNKINEFKILENKEIVNSNSLFKNFKYINNLFNNKYIEANYTKEKQTKLKEFFKFFRKMSKKIKKL